MNEEIKREIKESGLLKHWDEYRMERYGIEVNMVNRKKNFRRIAGRNQLKFFTRDDLVKNIKYLRFLNEKIDAIIEKFLEKYMDVKCPLGIKNQMAFLLDFKGDVLIELDWSMEIFDSEKYHDGWEKDYEEPLYSLIPLFES